MIDFHNHIGKDTDGGEQTFNELVSKVERYGIDHAVAFPFSNPDDELINKSLKILEKSKREERIIPFIRVNPTSISKDRFDNLLSMGFKGVKLHPESQKFFPYQKDVFWFYERVLEKELPILFHSKCLTKYSDPDNILKVAEKYPKLKIVLAHFLGDSSKLIIDPPKLKNVYTDISIRGRTLRLKQFFEKGFDRVLLGSDSPYDNPEISIMKVKKSGLNKKDQEKVLSKNAEKLLKVDN